MLLTNLFLKSKINSIKENRRGESDYARVSVNVISYFRKQKFGLIILDQNV